MDAKELGIPELDPALQADRLIAPVRKWGTQARGLPHDGTWHFYTHDYKFTSLRRRYAAVPETGAPVAVEPNFSVTPETTPAEAIWLTHQKRTIAREWQRRGVKLLVDLNVAAEHRETNLLGVPRGWRSYATRSHFHVPASRLREDFEAAVFHAGSPCVLFAVFGGGKKVRELCGENDWLWVPEHRSVIRGDDKPYG